MKTVKITWCKNFRVYSNMLEGIAILALVTYMVTTLQITRMNKNMYVRSLCMKI